MIKNKALVVMLGATIGYWALQFLLPDEVPRLFFTGLSLGIASVIVATWGPNTFQAILRGGQHPEDQLVIAVFMTWAYILLTRIYAAVYYTLDKPIWLANSPISGFLALSAAGAGLLVLIAPGLMPAAIKGRYKVHVIIAITVGTVIAAFMLGLVGGYTVGLSAEMPR